MKRWFAPLIFLLMANAASAQVCVPYFVVEFCLEDTYWATAESHEFDSMVFREDDTLHLEVGNMGSIGYEEYLGPNFDALNAVMDRTFAGNPASIDRFIPLGDDIPAVSNTSLYEADGQALVHTLYAINGMMLWIITSETADTVSETHIQRHIEALKSIQAQQ
ncbi:MAG: hypothetical protein JKY31_11170 [Rhodobacteraceae bacterium]|nr:hypothetical protein [Paracoccaceae bacterium]